jgi:VWFA-related protein
MRRALVWTCLALGVALAARADDAKTRSEGQTPAFPAQVEQVTVDVVVADKQGGPITGLKRLDFTLSEDGVPQAIASFEPIELAAPGPRPVTTRLKEYVSSNTDAAQRTARTFVIVFDGLHLSPVGAESARKAIEKFLATGLRDDDYVMLLGTQSGTWVSTRFGVGRQDLLAALKRQKGTAASDVSWDYMSEYEALRIDAYRDPDVGQRVARRWRASGYMLNFSREELQQYAREATEDHNPGTSTQPGTIEGVITDKAREVRQDMRLRQDATLELLRRVLNSLTDVKGRKSVLFVSEGFVVDLESRERRPVNEAARRANAAIYFVDARGLTGLPAFSTAAWNSSLNPNDTMAYIVEADFASEGTQAVAADSGGFTVRNGNDLAGAMDRIARESQSYYLLGYYPTRTTPDGKFHKISVAVSRKDVVVRARRGYFAGPGDSEDKATPAAAAPEKGSFQAAVDSPYDLDGVPLRLTTHAFNETSPGKVRTAVVADVEVSGFRWQTKDDRSLNAVEFLLLVANRKTDEVQRFDQTIELNLREDTRAQLQAAGMPIVREFELAPGRYAAKLIVREKNSDRIGTVAHEFVVPEPGGLRLSTPLLTDSARGGGQAGPQLVMKAQRAFPAGAMIACRYEVYGAKLSESDAKPHVSGGYAILRQDGTVVSETPETAINAPNGSVVRTLLFSLDGLEPGEYRVQLKVKDEVAGKSVEEMVPFVVTAARASAQVPGKPASTR